MIFLSSNAFSVDDQTADVLSHLSNGTAEQQAQMETFVLTFPEYNTLEWSGSWVDTEASGVDPDYMSWVRDWIEERTDVSWNDGEPVIWEDGDENEFGEVYGAED